MYKQIKELADGALALQNKDSMDAALRAISATCQAAADEWQRVLSLKFNSADSSADAMHQMMLLAQRPEECNVACDVRSNGEPVAPDDIMNSATEDEALEKLAAITAKQMPKRKGGAK